MDPSSNAAHQKSTFDTLFTNYGIPCVNFVGDIFAQGRDFIPVAALGAIGARIAGLPFPIGIVQGVGVHVTHKLVPPIDRYLESKYGPGDHQIHRGAQIVINTGLIFTYVLAPTAFTAYCAPTVFNKVGSLLPDYIGSWFSVDPSLSGNLSIYQVVVLPILPEITAAVIKFFRSRVEANEQKEQNKLRTAKRY